MRNILDKFWEITKKVPGIYQESTGRIQGKRRECSKKYCDSTGKEAGMWQDNTRKVRKVVMIVERHSFNRLVVGALDEEYELLS